MEMWDNWDDVNFRICRGIGLIYFNPFKPEFTIVIFIHYKTWITVAIIDL